MKITAGADARTIQPDLGKPVYLAGFSRNRKATGTHDPLMVRTLALSDGSTTLVLAVCDLIGFARIDTLDMRRRIGAPASTNIVIACTHTHSGADTIGLWGPDTQTTGCDADYIEWVKGQVVASCKAAIAQMQPAQLRATLGEVRGVVKNIRDPHIVDHAMGVLQAVNEGGTAIFTLLNFPCHPELMNDDNTLLTADIAGFACRTVERELGGVGIWASGHLGGMMTPDSDISTFEESRRLGEKLAEYAVDEIRIGIFEVTSQLDGMTLQVNVPLDNPLLSMASAVGLLRAGEQRDVVTTEVTVWNLGLLGQVAFVPGELLPALGLQLKQHMRGSGKFVIGLANDEIGYILPKESFVRPADYMSPGRQYEESMSLGAEAGPMIVDTLAKLLQSQQ